MVGAALFSILANASTLADSRVYPLIRPQTAPLPAITYQIISAVRLHHFGRDGGHVAVRAQVDCWAATYTDARTLADEVGGLLSRFKGGAGGVTISDVLLDNEQELSEAPNGARISMDFRIFVNAP